MDTQLTSVSLLAVTSSISLFPQLLPDLPTVRKTVSDPATINDVRMGEVAAAALAVAIGITGSTLTKSPIPATLAIVSALALVCMYESVLQTVPRERKV
jgi:hypothetical protein